MDGLVALSANVYTFVLVNYFIHFKDLFQLQDVSFYILICVIYGIMGFRCTPIFILNVLCITYHHEFSQWGICAFYTFCLIMYMNITLDILLQLVHEVLIMCLIAGCIIFCVCSCYYLPFIGMMLFYTLLLSQYKDDE